MSLTHPLKAPAPLDPGFLPAVIFNRHYLQTVRASGQAVPLVIGLERECGLVSRYETVVHRPVFMETSIPAFGAPPTGKTITPK